MWEEGQKVNTHTHTHTYTHTKRGEGGKEKEGSLLSRRRRQQSGGGGGGSGSGGSSTWQRRARPLPVTSGTHHRGGERGRGGSPGPAAAAPNCLDPLRASPRPARSLGAQPVPLGGGVRAPAGGPGWGWGRGWGAASPPAGVCGAAVRSSGSWSRGSSGEKMEDARVWRWPPGHSWAVSRDSESVPSSVASVSDPQRRTQTSASIRLLSHTRHGPRLQIGGRPFDLISPLWHLIPGRRSFRRSRRDKPSPSEWPSNSSWNPTGVQP
ncbi:uncharacterized protein LOC106027021 isoform X1 [Cavia porcellus]|uniref:uncharacterized protein LOC106027021 isoform X1 n=1 Tax=Cavia porcellus TaxID=10141 RepID=UPI002FE05921